MKTNIDNLSHSNPFTTPEGYFSQLEETILSKTAEGEKKANPFKTPDSYFDELETAIISRMGEKKEEKKGKVISLFSKKLYWTSAAACLFFAILAGIYIFNTNTGDKTFVSREKERVSVEDKLYIPEQNKGETPESPVSKDLYVSKSNSNFQTTQSKVTPVSQTKKTESNKLTEKSSEVIYNLYFNDDNEDADMEEEFFL